MKRKIVVVATDAGACAAIAPVAAKLVQNLDFELNIFASAISASIFKSYKLENIVEISDDFNPSDDVSLLTSSALLVGTSWGRQVEKNFMRWAKYADIPTLAVLDYWSNYRSRFYRVSDTQKDLPQIAIMDQRAANEMIAEGFLPESLKITGSPALEAAEAYDLTPYRKAELGQLLKIGPDEKVILFASQPILQVYGHSLGYTQSEVQEALIKALEKVVLNSDKKITLLIKAHPRENLNSSIRSTVSALKIIQVTEGTGKEWVKFSDLVIGMQSILLAEACYMKRIALSLQPGLKGIDSLATNLTGHSVAIYSTNELEAAIKNYLFNLKTRAAHFDKLATLLSHSGATDKIIKLFLSIVEDRRFANV